MSDTGVMARGLIVAAPGARDVSDTRMTARGLIVAPPRARET
jgi:hypothetical protein